MMAKRPLSHLLIPVGFMGMLSLPMLARLAGMEPGEVENRALTEAPAFQIKEAMGANYVDETWGAFLQDQLALRDWALHLQALVSLNVFRESPNPRVLMGKDGFLFYEQEVDRGCAVNWESAEVIVDNVRAWSDYFKRSGGEMVLVLVPDKVMIYRDKLTEEQLERYACVDQKNAAVRKGLAEIESLTLFDLYDDMKAEAAMSVEPPYYHKDTHWKWRYGLTIAERLVSHLKPGLYDPTAVKVIEQPEQTDLAFMIGLKHMAPAETHHANRPGISLHSLPAPDPINRLLRAEGPPSELVSDKVTLVSDSFFNRSVEVFASYAPELTQIHPFFVNEPAVSEALHESRYFVIQAVMRNIYEMFSDGLNQQSLERFASPVTPGLSAEERSSI